MKEINIAKTIIRKRKEKKITQDDLANFIGVSKASVSKWETGQSYPDIVLLPQLAAYFNISIDELMSYEPQMINEDIRILYRELSAEFAIKPFDEVMGRCRDITKKYFSCFPLLFQIGALFVNYSSLCKDSAKAASVITEAKELFVRVKNESDDVELRKLALFMEALCELMQGNPNEVIELLKGRKALRVSHEVLLASAYQTTGRLQDAKTELQMGIYECIIGLFGSIPLYLTVCADDIAQFDEVCRRTTELIKMFKIKELHPSVSLNFFLAAAQGYMANKNTERSLDMLESYAEVAVSDIYPLKLKGDSFFNLIDNRLNEFPFGADFPPRDEKTIKQSMADAVTNNPAFSALVGDLRFIRIAERLKNNAEEGL